VGGDDPDGVVDDELGLFVLVSAAVGVFVNDGIEDEARF
jgi:hypothetical protein